jgi:hypothetical protein
MRCSWADCEAEAEVDVVGREGSEEFVLSLCRRHRRALAEQDGPWHLEDS